MSTRDLSVRANLILLILSASSLAVLFASFAFGIYERSNYRSSAVRELTALADTLGANTAASLAFNDQKAAEGMLGALATEPHVLAAFLYNTDGSTFAEYRGPRNQTGLVVPALRPDGAYFDGKSLMLFRGVLLNGERTGSIALDFDLSDLRSRLFEYAKIALLVLILSVIATLLVSWRLAASIGNPLVQLADVARRVSADKDYSLRAAIHAGGETGLLIQSFNEMLTQIESRERALKESEERYALAARGANDGLWDWNLATDEIYFSPRWNHMLGYPVSGVWSSPEEWFNHIHVDDRERVHAAIDAHCEGKTSELVSEYRMRHGSGGYIWTLSRGIAVRDESGEAVRMAGSQTDITEGKISDPLTHIPNRLYFMDRLESAIETAHEEGALFAVLFIDLDKFKLVNDSLGHAVGDELLIDVAGRLRASLRTTSRPGDPANSVVARVGGDEFAILLTHMRNKAEPSIVAARVLERLNQPFYVEGRHVSALPALESRSGLSAAHPKVCCAMPIPRCTLPRPMVKLDLNSSAKRCASGRTPGSRLRLVCGKPSTRTNLSFITSQSSQPSTTAFVVSRRWFDGTTPSAGLSLPESSFPSLKKVTLSSSSAGGYFGNRAAKWRNGTRSSLPSRRSRSTSTCPPGN